MSKPIIILLADDDPEDQDILEEYLLIEHEIIIFYRALDGNEAINLITGKTISPPQI